jgi:ribose/xylose/arabinose/galactoside ABC-type transport system permease subunit
MAVESAPFTRGMAIARLLFPSRAGVLGQKVLINLVILALIWVVLSILAPRFLSGPNLSNVFRQIAFVTTVGSVVTLLMVSRNFDLSVGGLLALSGCVAASLANSGWPVAPSFVAGVLVGTLAGLTNGFLVVVVGINSVIATLGMMYLARGSALLVTNGLPVYTVPPGYEYVGTAYVGPIPVPVIVMAAFILAMTLVARRTLLGKYARATGSNPVAARLSGVPTRAVPFVLFVLAGTAAGWGGVMVSSRVGGGYPTVGMGFEFEVVVAAVLGGTSLAGGQGTVFGTFLGALIVGSLNNGLDLLGIPTFWQTVALGVVLLLAVGLDSVLKRRRGVPGSVIRHSSGTLTSADAATRAEAP